jgi:ubiquitin-like modifier-activating enzyme ATG7
MASTLVHLPFSSSVDPAFWAALSDLKMTKLKLDSTPQPLRALYAPAAAAAHRSEGDGGTDAAAVAWMNLAGEAFDVASDAPRRSVGAVGAVTVVNTMDEFKAIDKKDFLSKAGEQICAHVDSGNAEQDPSLLVHCEALVFSDLKNYKHIYWFAFPALCLPTPPALEGSPAALASRLPTPGQRQLLHLGVQQLQGARGKGTPPFFIVELSGESVSVRPLRDVHDVAAGTNEWWLAFVDPSPLPTNPGWPLRNALFLMQRRVKLTSVAVLCYRDVLNAKEAPEESRSILLRVALPPYESAPSSSAPAVVGWEANAKGKMGARMVDLAPFLDPQRRAVESADLNLKLMRWRFLPDLNIDRLARTKVLLVGAGTLGCNVARSLMAWGFRDMVFVDNGKVSFSNPTRQWLFDFSDCVDPARPSEGKPKAQAAADAIMRIVPNMKARGEELTIPMPGHPVMEASLAGVKRDLSRLEQLVDEADVVFLLTDTRESRWLPTVLSAAKDKPCVNVALGFDTFVIMRHGLSPPLTPPAAGAAGGGHGDSAGGPNLGCYFCNDVVAPMDSTRNRTLDQQCTATRPGLSAMASAMAVELAVTMLHHPLGALAPPDQPGPPTGQDAEAAGLGKLPHQIRGFVTNFSSVIVTGQAFKHCTACSLPVVQGYKRGGVEFLLRAFNEPDFLESTSGLKQMLAAAQDMAEDWEEDGDEWDDDA